MKVPHQNLLELLPSQLLRWIGCALCVCAVNSVQALTCGIAEGYPPYQFAIEETPSGFDADVMRRVAAEMGEALQYVQGPWDDMFGLLRVGELDCLVGMEINAIRQQYVLFTRPYYERRSAVFILAERTDIARFEDLRGRVVTGDRHSFLENRLRVSGEESAFRLLYTPSKQEAFRRLVEDKRVAASIMPKAVGAYLAKQRGVKVRILEDPDPGSSVAIAVAKTNRGLHTRIDTALSALLKRGDISRLYAQWFAE